MSFDENTVEFLNALKPSTRKIYECGLSAFQSFYREKGFASVKVFLDQVEEDMRKPRLEKKRVARNVFREFIVYLQGKGLSPKTIGVYVASVQSEAKYFDLPISMRYVDMPSQLPVSSKYPWTLKDVSKFIGLIDKPIYRSIVATLFQSGLAISDVLALEYGDIQREFESDVTPLCIDLARIKTDVPHLTFIGGYAVHCLREHLGKSRLEINSILYEISDRAVQAYFERLAKGFVGEYKFNNPARPHSLRAAFRTLLADAGMPTQEIEFFMGHHLADQERVYMSRSRDGWRDLYKKFESALDLSTCS